MDSKRLDTIPLRFHPGVEEQVYLEIDWTHGHVNLIKENEENRISIPLEQRIFRGIEKGGPYTKVIVEKKSPVAGKVSQEVLG